MTPLKRTTTKKIHNISQTSFKKSLSFSKNCPLTPQECAPNQCKKKNLERSSTVIQQFPSASFLKEGRQHNTFKILRSIVFTPLVLQLEGLGESFVWHSLYCRDRREIYMARLNSQRPQHPLTNQRGS